MKSLKLVKSDKFINVECNIYSDGDNFYITETQLGRCIGYSDGKQEIDGIISRNKYLKNSEFSAEVKLTSLRGNVQNIRVFTKDGIFEITSLVGTETAKQFRLWVRKLFKSVRSANDEMRTCLEIEKASVMKMNAENERLKLLLECVKNCSLSQPVKKNLMVQFIKQVTGLEFEELPEY